MKRSDFFFFAVALLLFGVFAVQADDPQWQKACDPEYVYLSQASKAQAAEDIRALRLPALSPRGTSRSFESSGT